MWIKTYETFTGRGIPIVVANPLRLGLRKSGAKTDPKDAARLANKLRMNDLEDAICHVYDADTIRIIDLLRQITLGVVPAHGDRFSRHSIHTYRLLYQV